MDLLLIHKLIDHYKEEFSEIDPQEIYKWKAVKCFQDNWDIDATDFPAMLEASLANTKNLMDAGNYFPKRMIKFYAQKSSVKVKALFLDLFNEEHDLIDRIKSFRQGIQVLNDQYPERDSHYQDQRAVMVYLTLNYPDTYFIYKFGLFKKFCKKIDYHYQPKRGCYENIGAYLTLCRMLRDTIANDQELLQMHQERLTEDCYIDQSLHLLTQDFIYAVAEHFSETEFVRQSPTTHIPNVTHSRAEGIEIKTFGVDLTPGIIDHEGKAKRNKRVGDLGEKWVVDYEEKRLKDLGKPNLADKVKHISAESGDGAGYDIESRDKNGNTIYIEVKATTGADTTPFFITRNELERSYLEQENYYLYRVYNFKEDTGEADLQIIQGELSPLCQTPTQYKAGIKE
ncbi:MAG: DUF3883 domain-containing protein [Chloroflexota bacterium]